MPGKKVFFTTRVEPVSPPDTLPWRDAFGRMVEAPGTAPGSTTLIPTLVYHHSQIEMIDAVDIRFPVAGC